MTYIRTWNCRLLLVDGHRSSHSIIDASNQSSKRPRMWPLFSCPLCKAIIIVIGSCRWELSTIILGGAGEMGNHQRVCEQYHPLAPGRSQAGCSHLMPLSSVSRRICILLSILAMTRGAGPPQLRGWYPRRTKGSCIYFKLAMDCIHWLVAHLRPRLPL